MLQILNFLGYLLKIFIYKINTLLYLIGKKVMSMQISA